MARNYYAEINLHITWHTKESSPLHMPTVESVTHENLRQRCIKTRGVFLHAIGGIETHVHLCIGIAPTITISELVGDLKGASSHETNQKLGYKALEWQTGYGVVSFGTGDMKWVIQYVRDQRRRHGCGEVFERLERVDPEAPEAQAEQREAP
jgi:putative transposase